jgi:triacylglycerol lipase
MMPIPGPVNPESLPPPMAASRPGQLRVEEALASPQRLWVRGQVQGLDAPEEPLWRRWWGKRDTEPPPAELEIHVSGCTLRAPLTLGADGRFEALFEVTLPPARRGWRVVRHRLRLGAMMLEQCGLGLAPALTATRAFVVVLPLANTGRPEGPREMATSPAAARWTALLQELCRAGPGGGPVYYLAAVNGPEDPRHAELALAVTALGWPSGAVVVLAGDGEPELARGIDRLRWLLAGALDLEVLNLEARAATLLERECFPREDRAPVRQVVNLPADSPRPPGPSEDRRMHERPALRPSRSSRITRYPIVFCHGMLAFTTLRMRTAKDINYFAPLREFLGGRGFRVLYPEVSPTGGVTERARQLREQILQWTAEPVNLIAHSMGGLDARYLISRLGLAERVRSLTTIATPHRGTFLADWFTANFRHRIPLLMALEAFGMNLDGFGDCRPAVCREFNEATPDAPGVRYFSYGGEASLARLSPVLRRSWSIITPVEGANDGMVSVASARWGEYLGTMHADHFAQTPDKVALHPGEDFDSLGFFTRLVEELARRGF